MNLKLNLKKCQISIYILIAIIILFLLIFLIFSNSDDDSQKLQNGQDNIKPLNEETALVKTRVDKCLTNELKKALIIAGLRGGYIYDRGEYSFGGIIPDDTYSPKLISNLNLNWNTLQSKTLVYSSIIPTPAEIENNTLVFNGKKVFNQTVTEDFTKFIKSNFLKCLNFDDLNNSYEFNYTDYYGDVLNIDYSNQKVTIIDMDGKIGDKVRFDLENQDIIGEITEKSKETLIATFPNLENIQNEKITTINNLKIINENTNFKLDIKFNYENVAVQAHFPVSIKNKDSISTFEETTVKLNVRFMALLDFAKELVNYKYFYQKDIDYADKENVFIGLNNSVYFKTTDLREFTLNKKTIKNEDEHKQYTFSLIDENSRINGNPYVFNFGYENKAPIIDFKSINANFSLENQTKVITLMATKGDEIKYELRPYTTDEQTYDNTIFYFEETAYSGIDAEFKLTKNGSMYFLPKMEKMYTYPIKVTDGETIRKYTIVFMTGFPDNTNNTAATECFKFKNFQDSLGLFPISADFKNKLYSYKTGEYVNVFGLTPYYSTSVVDSDNIRNSQIYFEKSCVYNTNTYKITVSQTDSSGTSEIPYSKISQDETYFKFDVPMVNYPVKYTVEIMTRNDGTIMTEPFNITIYPASCLGPNSDETGLGVSCCDTNSINSKIKLATENSDATNLNFINSQILETDKEVFNENVYACYNFREIPDNNNELYDYSSNNIWGSINSKISSLFETNLKIKCQGKYPGLAQNIQQISTSNGANFGKLIGLNIGGKITEIDNQLNINLKNINSAEKCEFCSLDNELGFSLISNYNNKKIIFSLGLKENNSNTLYPLPSQENYNNVNILCDDSNWYGSEKVQPSVSDWQKISGVFGEGGSAKPLRVSLGYCSQGSVSCTGRLNTPTTKYESDSAAQCKDYYFGTNMQINSKANTGWSCSTDKTCNNGVCK